MIRRPPRSTRTDTSFPTRRSSDLAHAKTSLGHEPGLFVRAYDTNPTEACRFVPESIYAGMERAGLVRSGGTASKPPEKTFAEKVADWNRDIESRGKAKELERSTTGRTCVTEIGRAHA